MTRLAILLRSALLILTLVCVSQTMARSQKYKVTIKAKEQRLLDVFKTIQQQTKLIVFYSNTILNDQEKVSIQVKDEPLEKVLDQIVFGKALKYEVQEKYIVISPKEVKSLALTEGINPQLENLPPPTKDISGKVTDAEGNPLVGASIKVINTKQLTITDVDGVFVLKDVDEKAIVEISFVGFERKTINVNSLSTNKIVVLIRKENLLDEIQIKAYGTTSRRTDPGNISSVKAKDIANQPVNNPLLALQGRVPGLVITQGSGLAGSSIKVRIQGQNSLRDNGNEPLYIIDGMPYNSTMTSTTVGVIGTTMGNPLFYINPSDIESIDVLKDSDATAIYGSRGANGVILITTKKGKIGKLTIDVNMRSGWGKVTRKIDMMDRRQYLDMRYEGFKNDGLIPSSNPQASAPFQYAPDLTIWDTTRNTDWQKELIGGTAEYSDINLGISGGNAIVQYTVGGNFHRETTVFPLPDKFADRSGSVHFKINSASANGKIKIQFSGNYAVDKNLLPRIDFTAMAVQLSPVAPSIYNKDGSLNWMQNSAGTSTWLNPMAQNSLANYDNLTNNLVSSIQFSYRFTKNFQFTNNIGFTNTQVRVQSLLPLAVNRPETQATAIRSAQFDINSSSSWNWEPQLTYNSLLGKGRIEILSGAAFLANVNIAKGFTASGHSSDQVLENITAGTSLVSTADLKTEYKYNALYGRLNYNWDNKYVANINARYDGSSRFGPKNRFHTFWSVGGAWVFSKEKWLDNSSILSFGKLKASYGTTGSDQLTDYTYFSSYFYNILQIPYQNSTALFPVLGNPYLEWEETRKAQIGLDIGFFKDKIVFGASISKNRSSNQLSSYTLPTITGFRGISSNVPAVVQNSSYEFSINTVNIEKAAFKWTSMANITFARNKLVDFPDLESSSYAATLIIGQPISFARAYRYAGVDPLTGGYMAYDWLGNPTLTPNGNTDRVLIQNLFPKFHGWLQNTLSYKNFQFDFLFQFIKQIGGQVLFNNGSTILPGAHSANAGNQPAILWRNHWSKPGDIATTQAFHTVNNSAWRNYQANATGSDANSADASFVRLKNVSLTYTLPDNLKRKMGLQAGRLFLQAQNLLTITKYEGLDPENRGVSSLPPLRVITFGIQLSF